MQEKHQLGRALSPRVALQPTKPNGPGQGPGFPNGGMCGRENRLGAAALFPMMSTLPRTSPSTGMFPGTGSSPPQWVGCSDR